MKAETSYKPEGIGGIQLPLTLRIARIEDEARDIRTFYFKHKLNAKPGQFVNLWIPGVDEKPFSVGYQSDSEFGLTIAKVGTFTHKLFEMKVGDYAGIRGPFGKWFTPEGKHWVFVAGGYGAAPLGFFAEEALKNNLDISVDFLIGARVKDLLIFLDRVKSPKVKVTATTNDGSHGVKGNNTDVLEKLLAEKKIDKVFSCGPEMMLKKVADICEAHGVKCELSIERNMKCGFGICGLCCVDSEGWRVCTEGTIFTGEEAKKITEFGSYHRDSSGTRQSFQGGHQ